MTQDHFKIQAKRLMDTYGKQHFSEERLKLIWLEVKDFADEWFENVCSGFIGYMRQAPMVTDFREACSIERERVWAREKIINKRESEWAMKQLFDGPMIKSICKTISSRIIGAVDDETFENFVTGIGRIGAQPACKICGDEGYVFGKDDHANDCVSRCPCPVGVSKPCGIPIYQPELRLVGRR